MSLQLTFQILEPHANASINVKPEGGPRAYVGHLTFQKNF